MGSKKLNIPTTNFDYAAVARQPVSQQPVKSFPSKGRMQRKRPEMSEDDSWKYDLPAYQYQTKSGKKMDMPQRDDSLLGGYANLRAGRMTMQSARSYMEAKAAEDAKRAKAEARRNAEFNPFNGLFDDEDDNENESEFI